MLLLLLFASCSFTPSDVVSTSLFIDPHQLADQAPVVGWLLVGTLLLVDIICIAGSLPYPPACGAHIQYYSIL
jgi:hypothetical protein